MARGQEKLRHVSFSMFLACVTQNVVLVYYTCVFIVVPPLNVWSVYLDIIVCISSTIVVPSPSCGRECLNSTVCVSSTILCLCQRECLFRYHCLCINDRVVSSPSCGRECLFRYHCLCIKHYCCPFAIVWTGMFG